MTPLNPVTDAPATLGQRLRAARKARRMSQGELAQRISVHRNTISCYERDADIPGSNTLAALCDALGVSADWLLTGTGTIFRHATYPYYEWPFHAQQCEARLRERLDALVHTGTEDERRAEAERMAGTLVMVMARLPLPLLGHLYLLALRMESVTEAGERSAAALDAWVAERMRTEDRRDA